jgi:hypothetical protein
MYAPPAKTRSGREDYRPHLLLQFHEDWAIASEDEKETWFSLLEKKIRWALFLYFDPQKKKGS